MVPKDSLVVASPLSRAIQTALLAFDNVLVHPAVIERGGGVPENIPRSIDALEEEFGDRVDFSLLRTDVWPRKQTEADLKAFVEWLDNRPEETIYVVCHYNTINRLTRAPAQWPTATRSRAPSLTDGSEKKSIKFLPKKCSVCISSRGQAEAAR